MLGIERQNYIIRLLEEKKFLRLSELVEQLRASEATIRRDLNTLERKGRLLRVHGGAKLLSKLIHEKGMSEKKNLHLQEKQKIAKLASKYLEDGQKIYLDAGSTVEALIPYLEEKKNIEIVTNGYSHLSHLLAKGIPTYLIAGRVKEKTQSLVGARAVLSLRDFYFDIAFLGANSMNEETFMTPDPEEAIVKEAVVRKANKSYILADRSKWGQEPGIVFAGKEDVILITEEEEK